jgi:sucrose-6-phosphate hydrolase SacC (GH32 family)
MRWRRLGKIFDPRDVALPAACREFAQSPQVIEFPDFLRVYFSTRSVDEDSGMYRSHVAWVDMDRSLHHVLRVADREVIPLGGLGCFDEHGIFPMSVVRHGSEILAYTTGWSRRRSVSVDTAIGLAISLDDGITFEHTGPGPVLAASLHEQFLVGDGFVRIVGGTFHMWYIFGTEWRRAAPGANPERTYKIGHAVSPDGIAWTREDGRRIIPDRLGPDESQALPTVLEIDGRHHMLFCYRESVDFRTDPGRSYRIGHADSEDLRTWTRDDADALPPGEPGEWDAEMQCYPHVFACDGRALMLYNGNEFGRFGFGAAVLEP